MSDFKKQEEDRAKDIRDKAKDTYLGLSGTMWCLLAGLCYGTLNLTAKMSFESGMTVTKFILWRHVS